MRNVSKAFYDTMEYRTDFYCDAEITFQDGSKKSLGKGDFSISGNSVVESAESNSFPLGVLVPKQITLVLMNDDERWSQYDFLYAKIFLRTKFDLDTGLPEILNIGTFTVITPENYGSTIALTAMDDCYRLDTDYDTKLPYPLTIGEIVRDSCNTCGVSLLTTTFNNSNYSINEKPSGITHRKIIALCAMIAGGNARFDEYNRLKIIPYDFSDFEGVSGLNGGIFDNLNQNIYETGDNVYGGVFNPWDTGDIYDSGDFTILNNVHVLYNFKNIKLETDDVVITGVQLKGKNDEKYLYGEEGYVLTFENMLASGKESEVAGLIGERVVGLQFRPFTADHIAYPLAEFMDLIYIIDRNGNGYKSVITDVDFEYFGFTTLKCSADSPIRNSSKYFGESAEAVIKAREETSQKISDYDKNVQNMTSLISQGFGLYFTSKKQEDGSEKWYMHDKPTIAESGYTVTMGSNGLIASKDGGVTWAVDANGNALFNVLSVVGFYFDWAKGGNLTLGGYNNQNGKLYILDAAQNTTGSWTKDGLITNKATFTDDIKWTKQIVNTNREYISEYETFQTTMFGGNPVDREGFTLKMKDKWLSSDLSGAIHISPGYAYQTNMPNAIARRSRNLIVSEDPLYICYDNSVQYADNGAVRCYIELGNNEINLKFESSETSSTGTTTRSTWMPIGIIKPLGNGTKAPNIQITSSVLRMDANDYFTIYGKMDTTLTSGNTVAIKNSRWGEMASSSKRYKKIKRDMIAPDVEELYNIQPVFAKYNDDYLSENDERYGAYFPMFIAENVDKYFPDAVDHNESGESENWNERIMIPAMFEMIKLQKETIDNLNERIEKLEALMKGCD